MVRVKGLRPAMLRAVCARCGRVSSVLCPARAYCPRCGLIVTVSDGRETVFHGGRVAAVLAARHEYHRARRAARGFVPLVDKRPGLAPDPATLRLRLG